jgi:hypothetical protein
VTDPDVPRAEWASRTAFAEAAEALRIPSDLVVAAVATAPDRVMTLWTPTGEDDAPLYSTTLGRDADGVLVPMGEPTLVADSFAGWLRQAGFPE